MFDLGMDRKRELVEELLQHLDKTQGDGLAKLIEEKKNAMNGATDGTDGAPAKGIAIEKLSIMKPKDGDGGDEEMGGSDPLKDALSEGTPEHEASESPEQELAEKSADEKGDDEQLTDEELAELLQKYLGQ